MRKWIIALIVIAVLAAGGWFGYQRFAAAQKAVVPTWETVTVPRGDISATVSATGAVLPEQEANLAFKSAGTIAEVKVKVGDRVSAGQALAQLDTTDLTLAVRQAEIGLRTTEAQLRQLQIPSTASDLGAAQAALDGAKAAYQQLLRGASEDELAAARAQVEQARVQLSQVQQAYDKVKERPDVGMLPQSLQLQQATIAYETAQAQYRVTTRKATSAQLAQSQAQIAQAQANLDRLQKGPTAEQLEIAQASLDQSSLALEQAQRRVADAALVAPWDGTITAVAAVAGTIAQPGAPAFRIADVSRYHLNVQVDEVDIAGIEVGQAVSIEVDALPDERLSGQVQAIAPSAASLPTGGVTYEVRIDLPPSEAKLRAGMSATATIISSTRKQVLLIPNRAISLERETGRTFVEVLVGAEPQRTEVRLGLRDDLQAEVRDGLQEGDTLVIRQRSSLERLQQTFSAGQ